MRRSGRVVLAVLTLLLATSCSGDSEGSGAPPRSAGAEPAATPELPPEVETYGSITEPAMEPVWLVRSTGVGDGLESRYEESPPSQGLFVHDDVTVYWAYDTAIGVSTSTGEEIWRNPVDMGGEVIQAATPRATADHRWTFIHEHPESSVDQVVTVDVRTGEVLASHEIGPLLLYSRLLLVGDRPYLTTRDGIVAIDESGAPQMVTPLRAFRGGRDPDLEMGGPSPVAGHEDLMVVELSRGYEDHAVVAGVEVPSGRILWKRELSSFVRRGKDDEVPGTSRFDGRWIFHRQYDSPGGVDEFRAVHVLDPRTGKTVHSSRTPYLTYGTGGPPEHAFSTTENDTFTSGSYRNVLPVPGSDDFLLEDRYGITRYDVAEGKVAWSSDSDMFQLSEGKDPTWTLGEISEDQKYVYAMYTSGVAGDVVAIELETGEVHGRWSVPPEHGAGLLQKPLFVVAGQSLVLGRNQDLEGSLTDHNDHTETLLGESNDVGWLTFPEVG